jgi:hypothetical protein
VSTNSGLVAKMSLLELVKSVKKANPNVADYDDVRVAAMFLKRFPDQVSLLKGSDAKVAKRLLDEGDESSIKDFYGVFGKRTMEGVSLDQAPDFIKQLLKTSGTKMVSGSDGDASVAHVNPGDMKRIYVDDPVLMDKPTMAHETVHIYQSSLKEPMKGDPTEQAGGHDANYEYGGWKGLLDAQAKRKSIRDFTDEQQAAMVGDYVRLQGAIQDPSYMSKSPEFRKQMLEEWDEANRALGPYLRQLMTQPKEGEPSGGTIDTHPAPPGPPPASVSGIAIPLEGIGGKAAFFDPKSLMAHKGLVPKKAVAQ